MNLRLLWAGGWYYFTRSERDRAVRNMLSRSSDLRVSEGVSLMGLFLAHFQAAKEEWSQTLWINLNVQFLQEGIEGFLKALRKLPRQVRNLSVAYYLEAKMKAFKDSIPLLLDLKHDAMRDRCVLSSAGRERVWEELSVQIVLLRSDDGEQGFNSDARLEACRGYFYNIVSVKLSTMRILLFFFKKQTLLAVKWHLQLLHLKVLKK